MSPRPIPGTVNGPRPPLEKGTGETRFQSCVKGKNHGRLSLSSESAATFGAKTPHNHHNKQNWKNRFTNCADEKYDHPDNVRQLLQRRKRKKSVRACLHCFSLGSSWVEGNATKTPENTILVCLTADMSSAANHHFCSANPSEPVRRAETQEEAPSNRGAVSCTKHCRVRFSRQPLHHYQL